VHDLGDVVPLSVVVRDSSDTPTNAATISCTVTLPDGTLSVSSPTPSPTGTYSVDFVTTQAGHHQVRWVSTGPSVAHTDVFDVSGAVFRSLVSLESARRKCNITGTERDDDLRELMEAATEIVEDHTGRTVVPRTYSEIVRGNGSTVVLSHTPVVSVASVTSLDGTTTWDPSELVVDANSGVAYATSTALHGPMVVTYSAGAGQIPNRYRRAALIIVEHLFAWERPLRKDAMTNSYDTSMGETFRGAGFAIPNAALELLGKPAPMVG
jgi:uncharacterized phiE125 gp8 family phage protein